MLHVAECKLCGPILRQYLREFSEEQSPENIAILNQLQSSKPPWQKKLVRKLIGGGRPISLAKACAGHGGAGGGDLCRGSGAIAIGSDSSKAGAKSRWPRLL